MLLLFFLIGFRLIGTKKTGIALEEVHVLSNTNTMLLPKGMFRDFFRGSIMCLNPNKEEDIFAHGHL